MDFDLELLLEGFALGFDAIIIGFLYKSYESCSTYIEALKVCKNNSYQLSYVITVGTESTNTNFYN
jgi:hypothetical protein